VLLDYVIETGWLAGVMWNNTVLANLYKINKDKKKRGGNIHVIWDRVPAHFKSTWIAYKAENKQLILPKSMVYKIQNQSWPVSWIYCPWNGIKIATALDKYKKKVRRKIWSPKMVTGCTWARNVKFALTHSEEHGPSPKYVNRLSSWEVCPSARDIWF
jgi:hypothetical protein